MMVNSVMKAMVVGLCLALLLPGQGGRAEPVDVKLLMAIDASASVTQRVLDAQIDGHAAAFRDPLVQAALRSGPRGQIAVALMLWSNPTDTPLVVPWRVLRTPEDAWRMARDIDALPRKERAGSTGLGAALAAGERHLRNAPHSAPRQIIDVSSNGFSNIGPRPEFIKPTLEEAGIEVNAIVILNEYDWLRRYYTESVVTGPAPFVMAAGEMEHYADAILRKLVRELS